MGLHLGSRARCLYFCVTVIGCLLLVIRVFAELLYKPTPHADISWLRLTLPTCLYGQNHTSELALGVLLFIVTRLVAVNVEARHPSNGAGSLFHCRDSGASG